MDIRKVLRILNLILELESKYNIQSLFQNINSYFDQNNPEQINDTKANIYSYIKNSEILNFVNSDTKILKNIWIYWYFDISLMYDFETILNSPSYEVRNKLMDFINKRSDLLNKITSLKSSIDNLEIEVEQEEITNYNIIFSFSEKYHHLDQLEKVSKDIRLFLNELNSKTWKSEEYKISSVNNWCIEFFIKAWEFLANNFSIAIEYIIKIYSLIKIAEDWAKVYNNYSEKRKLKAKEIANEQLSEDKNRLLDEFLNKLSLSTPEDITRVKSLFITLSKHFENWVTAEVKTPLIDIPREYNEDDSEEIKKELEKNKRLYNNKKEIDERNRQLFLFQQENIKLSLPEAEKKEKRK